MDLTLRHRIYNAFISTCHVKYSCKMIYYYSWIFVLLNVLVHSTFAAPSWQKSGCYRIGHTRTVKIAGCLQFNVTANACRGFCESYTIPSSLRTIFANENQILTSRAECCGIQDTHDIPVSVRCADGIREVTFKSARSCACSICRSR